MDKKLKEADYELYFHMMSIKLEPHWFMMLVFSKFAKIFYLRFKLTNRAIVVGTKCYSYENSISQMSTDCGTAYLQSISKLEISTLSI